MPRWSSALRERSAPGAAMLSGALFLVSFPPFGLWPLIGVALVPLLLVRRRLTTRQLFGTAYAMAGIPVAGIGYGIAVAHAGAFAVVALCVPAAFAAAVVAADALERRTPSPARTLLTFPAMAVVIEYVLSAGFEAPATIALALTAAPVLIQTAELVGAPGTTFLIILANVGVTHALQWRSRDRSQPADAAHAPRIAAAAAALVVANTIYGVIALQRYADLAPRVEVAAIQPAISSATYRERWFHPEAQDTIDTAIDGLVRDALASKPRLLLLPEGSDGRYRFRVPELRVRTQALARTHGVSLLVSSPDLTADDQELNAVFSVGTDGALLGRHAKQIFTPVGEDYLSRGSARRPLLTEAGLVGAMVCFESCFASVARDLVQQGAKLLLVSTSDAAFRNGSLPLLHSAFSVFRAVENRRYVVQDANTGPSLIVAPTGVVAAETPFFTPAVLRGAVAPLRERSLYSRTGDVFPWVMIAGLALGLVRRRASTARPAVARPESAPAHTARRAVAYAGGYTTVIGGLVVTSILLSSSAGRHTDGHPAAALAHFVRAPAIGDAPPAAEFLQRRPNTCGAAALAFALRYYDVVTTEDEIAALIRLEQRGTTLGELARAAERLGMRASGVAMNAAALRARRQPTLAHVGSDHFVVVIEVADERVLLFDPARGLARLPLADFARHWNGRALTLAFHPIELDRTDGPTLTLAATTTAGAHP